MQLRFQFPHLPDAEIDELAGRSKRVALRNAAVAASFQRPLFTSTRLDVVSVDGVTKVVACGDDVCVANELRVSGAPALPSTCDRDCPVPVGATCPTPGTNEAGDPTKVRASPGSCLRLRRICRGNSLGDNQLRVQPCGGNGICMTASMTCECNALYTGDACQFCEPSARRAGAVCVPTVAVRVSAQAAWHVRLWWIWIVVAVVAALLLACCAWVCWRRRCTVAARQSAAPARARKRGGGCDAALLAEQGSPETPRAVAAGGDEIPSVGSAESLRWPAHL